MYAEEIMHGDILEMRRDFDASEDVRDDLVVITNIAWTPMGHIQFFGYFITDGVELGLAPVPPSRKLDVWTREGLR